MKMKLDGKKLLVDLLFDIAGCFIFAMGIQSFSAPNFIAPGGVSGVAIILEHLFQWRISVVSLAINIPLLIAGWIFLGHVFTLKTMKSVAILTLMLELCSYLPVYQGNELLAALYGGVIQGIGLALVFMRSSTTGGTEIASLLIQLRFPHISVGKLLMVVDGAVLIASTLVFRNIESALYGMVTIYTCTKLLDGILYGRDTGKVMLVISGQHEEIARRVNEELDRGGTMLQGKGTYTGADRPVLLCAVRNAQYIELKKVVREVDPDAFLVVLEAGEVLGEGFRPHNTQSPI